MSAKNIISAVSSAQKIHHIWLRSGQLSARCSKGDPPHIRGGLCTFHDAYAYDLSLETSESRFRDAVIDAFIELVNDCGGAHYEEGWQQLPSATGSYSNLTAAEAGHIVLCLAVFPGDWKWVGPKSSGDGKLLD
jgi:hypothetical protein